MAIYKERLPFVWKTRKFRGEYQMERFIPMDIFQKSDTFRGITFFPFLPKRPKLPGFMSREGETFTGFSVYAVAIWLVTGQGFQNTNWPAVLYSQ